MFQEESGELPQRFSTPVQTSQENSAQLRAREAPGAEHAHQLGAGQGGTNSPVRTAREQQSKKGKGGNMTIRVLLVDDHKMMRDGLRGLLEGEPDIEVVGDASDGRTALDLVRTLSPDVVVMDIGMPELNGVEATRSIHKDFESVKVVALSTHTDKRYVHHMLEAGACCYVLKIAAHDELLRAVRAASLGQTYLSPEIAGLVVERATGDSPGAETSAYSSLGAREREVLQLVAEGKTSGETAKQMHISIKTVETHRRNIAQKLGLHGTAELTKYASREGLTSLEN
jgi:two-component system NarL family response regulator